MKTTFWENKKCERENLLEIFDEKSYQFDKIAFGFSLSRLAVIGFSSSFVAKPQIGVLSTQPDLYLKKSIFQILFGKTRTFDDDKSEIGTRKINILRTCYRKNMMNCYSLTELLQFNMKKSFISTTFKLCKNSVTLFLLYKWEVLFSNQKRVGGFCLWKLTRVFKKANWYIVQKNCLLIFYSKKRIWNAFANKFRLYWWLQNISKFHKILNYKQLLIPKQELRSKSQEGWI